MSEVKSWNAQLANVWTKMVGPSRPTCSELNIYLKYIRELQLIRKRKLKMLVLGSTPEFRDLGFEESMDVTVIDCNIDYHQKINREIRHKVALEKEKIQIKKWQEIDDYAEYDIIIGDLITGNIKPIELEEFLKRVADALLPGGFYLGKSFYQLKEYSIKQPKDIVKKYYEHPAYHPYSTMIYDFSILCLEDDMLYFDKMFKIIRELYTSGVMDDETFEYFKNIGLDNEMKFSFYIPPLETYLDLLSKYMSIETIEYSNEVYAKEFPLVIAKKV